MQGSQRTGGGIRTAVDLDDVPQPAGAWPGFSGSPPPAVAPASAVGTSAGAAHGDHTHSIPFGGAPGTIAIASSAGVAATLSRSDHTHSGLGNIISCDGVNATGSVKLSAIDATTLQAGALAWAISVGAPYRLTQSALTVDHLTVETALNKTGYQWIRIDVRNRNWEAQTAWTVNTSTGSDEAAGTGGAPLLTMTELARRLYGAQLSAAIAVTLAGNMASTDKPGFTFQITGSGSFTITGTPTLLYTGTITTYTAPTAAPATDDGQITDAGITGGTFTAAGLMVDGVICHRTNGTVCDWYLGKDLGATAARVSVPMTTGGTAQALAPGDTYTASLLPTIQLMRFAESKFSSVTIIDCFPVAGTAWGDPSLFWKACWFSSSTIGTCITTNCAFSGGCSVGATTIVCTRWRCVGGMARSTGAGAILVFGVPDTKITARMTFQGSSLIIESGFCEISADIAAYDYTSVAGDAAAVGATYWGIILWSAGALAGSGVVGKLLNVNRTSSISYITSPVAVAGSSADGSPIHVGGTGNISVAALTAGGGAMNANQNGIFAAAV